jgi:hypothetical protein
MDDSLRPGSYLLLTTHGEGYSPAEKYANFLKQEQGNDAARLGASLNNIVKSKKGARWGGRRQTGEESKATIEKPARTSGAEGLGEERFKKQEAQNFNNFQPRSHR